MSIDIIESKLINNNLFFVIPSWGNLLGYPTLGNYAHHNVSKITHDLIIFLGGTECAISTDKGTLYYLFGLGYYYLKFELQSGRYTTDNRQLTGLILSDFVYDHLATSKNITLENEKDVIVSENLFKLPIDLSHKTETKKQITANKSCLFNAAVKTVRGIKNNGSRKTNKCKDIFIIFSKTRYFFGIYEDNSESTIFPY